MLCGSMIDNPKNLFHRFYNGISEVWRLVKDDLELYPAVKCAKTALILGGANLWRHELDRSWPN